MTVVGPAAAPPGADGDRIADAVEQVLPVLREHAAQADVTARFPLASLAALRRSGLMGLVVPVEYGGMGGGLREVARIGRLLANGCLTTAFAWVMHSQQVDTVVRFAEESLRARLLPKVADGAYLASVTTEASIGSTLLRANDALAPDREGYRFRRAAPVVTGGRHADGFLVKLRSSPSAAPTEVSLVYAGRDQLDVEVAAPGWTSLGMRGVENVGLVLVGAVPADQVVGGVNGFRRVVLPAFTAAAHIGWSACWLGAAQGAFSGLLREVRAGRLRSVDATSELARQRLATIRCRLEAVSAYLRCLVDEVVARQDAGMTLELPAVQIHINTLKVLAARQTFRAVDEMVGLAGLAAGYLSGGPVPLERLFRDLRAASLTYDDTRLLASNGSLTLLDPAVSVLGD